MDTTDIKVGSVVFVEGASALLGDVVSIDGPDEFGYTAAEIRWRQCFSTEDVEELELAPEQAPDPVVTRLKADLRYHQAKRAELAIELSNLDEAYSAETDTAESYHAGRVEALNDVLNLLAGVDVELYSETGIDPA